MRQDVHTHILPGMDDGAPNSTVAIKMLEMEWAQGIETVAFTPHYYRDRVPLEQFLERRRQSLERLQSRARECAQPLPMAALGAEVAWGPNLSKWDELGALCIGETAYFLLELPFYPWDSLMLDQIYALLACTRYIPIIAHLERYFAGQKQSYLQELCTMGVPIQFGAGSVLHIGGRGKILRLMRQGICCVLASDCHDLGDRRPNLGPALDLLEKKIPVEQRAAMSLRAEEILRGAVSLK